MADLSAFPITQKWPAADPNVLQLYSFPTPNGVKVSIALEEIGLPYDCLLYTSPSPRDRQKSRMPSSA